MELRLWLAEKHAKAWSPGFYENKSNGSNKSNVRRGLAFFVELCYNEAFMGKRYAPIESVPYKLD